MHWFLNKVREYYPKEVKKICPNRNDFSNFSEALTTYLSYIEFGGLLFLEKKEEELRYDAVLPLSILSKREKKMKRTSLFSTICTFYYEICIKRMKLKSKKD
jgi:hypothetical protein